MFYDVYMRLCEENNEKPYALVLKLGAKNNSIVANWKKLGSIPRPDFLQKIADYFGVSMAYILEESVKGSESEAKSELLDYNRLNELIAASGKTKAYLSQKMNHSSRYLNDAKKNNAKIKDSDLAILAEELNTTVAYLKGETNEKSPTIESGALMGKAKKELIQLCLSMSDSEADMVYKLVAVTLEGIRNAVNG